MWGFQSPGQPGQQSSTSEPVSCSCLHEAAPGTCGARAEAIVTAMDKIDVKERKRAEDQPLATVDEELLHSFTHSDATKQRRRQQDGANPYRRAPPAYLEKEVNSREKVAKESRAMMGVWEAPEYREMCQAVDRFWDCDETMPAWQQNICQNLRGLLSQVSLTKEGDSADSQLRKVYEWYRSHRTAFSKTSEEDGERIPLPEVPVENVLPPPCLAYQVRAGVDEGDGRQNVRGLGGGGAADAAASKMQARDRLKNYTTHAIVGPLTARKLRAAAAADVVGYGDSRCGSPDPYDRSFTPSTATGGCNTPSALGSSRPSSAANYVPRRPLTAGSTTGYRRTGPEPLSPTPAASSALPARPKTATGATSSMAKPAPSVSSGSSRPQTPSRPTPPTSRPGSALRLPGQPSVFLQRPEIPPLSLPQPPRLTPNTLTFHHTMEYHYGAKPVAPHQPSVSEMNMEDRWLARRNKDITAQVLVEEQRAHMDDWALRRARVEEEMNRNVEVVRFQSETGQRRYVPPADAEEDIEATRFSPEPVTEDEDLGMSEEDDSESGSDEEDDDVEQEARDTVAAVAPVTPSAGSYSAARAVARAQQVRPVSAAAPRINVIRPGAVVSRPQTAAAPGKTTVTFAAGIAPPKEPKPALNDRIAQLRRVHAQYLQATKLDDSDSEGEDPVPCIFDTEEGARYQSLSAYFPQRPDQQANEMQKAQAPRWEDDTDVLAGVCDWWRHKHGQQEAKEGAMPLGDGALDEMRFKQIQEVDHIKRVFARRNCPVDTSLLERALIMPEHRFRANIGLFNTMPNILRDPFFKKKKPKKKKKRLKAKGKAKSGTAGSRLQSPQGTRKPAKPRM